MQPSFFDQRVKIGQCKSTMNGGMAWWDGVLLVLVLVLSEDLSIDLGSTFKKKIVP